jgi:hypothetical protein
LPAFNRESRGFHTDQKYYQRRIILKDQIQISAFHVAPAKLPLCLPQVAVRKTFFVYALLGAPALHGVCNLPFQAEARRNQSRYPKAAI